MGPAVHRRLVVRVAAGCRAERTWVSNRGPNRYARFFSHAFVHTRSLRTGQIDEVDDRLGASHGLLRDARLLVVLEPDRVVWISLGHGLHGEAVEGVTATALVVHLRRCVSSIHLAQFEQADTFVEVLHDHLAHVPHEELFALGVFDHLKRFVRRRELFVQQVEHLVVINLEVAALHDEYTLLPNLAHVYLLKELLKRVNQNSFILGEVQNWRVRPLQSWRIHTVVELC
mmetsp:Transcript_32791/g.43234  ORF Transcript_32791/g.43234 Transcript_32791/m.43234 type:complete len:229 (+) Transcript_32791:1945-2631(+)